MNFSLFAIFALDELLYAFQILKAQDLEIITQKTSPSRTRPYQTSTYSTLRNSIIEMSRSKNRKAENPSNR